MSADPSDPGWIVCLDASTPRCVIAVGDGEQFLGGDAIGEAPNQASTLLVPRIEAALARAGGRAGQVRWVACGRGPGTFTGTRVAVATAMGLAVGAGCPIVEVSTLAAVAASTDVDGDVLALLDARRGEVYGARFSVEGDRVERRGEEHCAPIGTLLPGLSPHTIAIGPGVAPWADALPDGVIRKPMPGPTPEGLWRAAMAARAAGAVIDADRLRAVYLRESYAEMGVNPPKNPVFKSPFI